MSKERNLGLEDKLHFGRHSDKTIQEIYTDGGSAYLVWLREERNTKNRQLDFFNLEVNTLLDMTIEESSQLKSIYKTWGAIGAYEIIDKRNAVMGRTEIEVIEPEEPPPWAHPERAYGTWGAF